MSPEADHDRVYADLVGGLLDARDDPATARFDHELALAVEAGQVTAAAARRLRFWQRASLRLLADHTRSVLPTALGALEASRREAADYVAQLIVVVHEEAADVASGEAERAGAQRTTVESRADVTAATAPRDTPERASATGPPAARSLEERHRMIVADLVKAAPAGTETH